MQNSQENTRGFQKKSSILEKRTENEWSSYFRNKTEDIDAADSENQFPKGKITHYTPELR